MSFIKLPLNGTSVQNRADFVVVKADGVYDVEAADSNGTSATAGPIMHIYYTNSASTANEYLRMTITYLAATDSKPVQPTDVQALRDLIAKANQEPGSVPLFELSGAKSSATPNDFKVATAVGAVGSKGAVLKAASSK